MDLLCDGHGASKFTDQICPVTNQSTESTQLLVRGLRCAWVRLVSFVCVCVMLSSGPGSRVTSCSPLEFQVCRSQLTRSNDKEPDSYGWLDAVGRLESVRVASDIIRTSWKSIHTVHATVNTVEEQCDGTERRRPQIEQHHTTTTSSELTRCTVSRGSGSIERRVEPPHGVSYEPRCSRPDRGLLMLRVVQFCLHSAQHTAAAAIDICARKSSQTTTTTSSQHAARQ
jgi:hypothetical protein